MGILALGLNPSLMVLQSRESIRTKDARAVPKLAVESPLVVHKPIHHELEELPLTLPAMHMYVFYSNILVAGLVQLPKEFKHEDYNLTK
jgi:hypothetical protein